MSALNKTEVNFATAPPELNGRMYGDFIFINRNLNDSIVSGSDELTLDTDLIDIDVSAGYGARIGQTAQEFTRLRDIERFWDASGNFILEAPQTISIIQGDGNKASITLFATDTIQTVVDKMNEAIYEGLKQKNVVDAGLRNNFVQYIANPNTGVLVENASVRGTFVISSAITGNNGKFAFVGNDAVINAFSLMTIQQAKESEFKVTVSDAHTSKVVDGGDGITITGNRLIGVIHPNVDVEFYSNANIMISGKTGDAGFRFSTDTTNTPYVTFVHIADRTMVLHIGANQKQDIGAGIGNMGAAALGINNILVSDNFKANESIGKLDRAIDTVSFQRSKLGAIQNRLEHTISNLSTTAENLTASESRIRDIDMAKEMMNFTRLSILSQAATAMLAQANQMPQAVLQLLR